MPLIQLVVIDILIHFVRLGLNFNKVIPPWVSPTKIIGSLWLKAIFVNFGYFDGFYSANFPILSTLRS